MLGQPRISHSGGKAGVSSRRVHRLHVHCQLQGLAAADQHCRQQPTCQPLSGKVALITGATTGIGLATADYLAGQGATVIIGAIDYREGQDVADGLMRKHQGSRVEVAPQLDLACQDSVARCAEAVASRPGPLDILVNNAGVGNGYRHTCAAQQRLFTKQGVGMLTQVNHLGPYTLTRLLEPKLLASAARVVFVSSIVHRFAAIRDVRALFKDWDAGFYEHTKLANLYTAFEMQRRLGAQGVQACAVDPGAVRSNIWANNPTFSQGPGKAVIDACYAPPADAARVLLHAATCDWQADAPCTPEGGAAAVPPEQDLRYYARGVFAWPQICNDWAAGGLLQSKAWALNTVIHTTIDWPLRKLVPAGHELHKVVPARPGSHAYDRELAAALWEESARLAGLPAQPLVGSQCAAA
ncbi:hypothetical protein COO60DRAFT_441720 [Scenedesmus sp. NREL 46B-D3]|nr:hypothetical protein COO60DRAFT_441720 [Scenedesmus sp. NREL 46B-D3]